MNVPASLPVNYSNSTQFYPDETGVLGSFTKSPNAQTMVTCDYTSILPSGLTINRVAFGLNYGTAPQLIVSGLTIQGTGNVISFIMSGGVNGIKYNLEIDATLSDNQTVLVHTLEIVVSDGSDDCGCPTPVPTYPIPVQFQQARILNGDGTKFGSTFIVYWVGAVAPTTANILDRWYNTQDGLIYDRATDGISVFWVSSSSRPTQYTTAPQAPSAPFQGDMWFDTSSSALKVYVNNGSGLTWLPIG